MVRELEIINQCIIVSGRAEQARYCMVREPGKINQCIIFSGESSAGKVLYGERAGDY